MSSLLNFAISVERIIQVPGMLDILDIILLQVTLNIIGTTAALIGF